MSLKWFQQFDDSSCSQRRSLIMCPIITFSGILSLSPRGNKSCQLPAGARGPTLSDSSVDSASEAGVVEKDLDNKAQAVVMTVHDEPLITVNSRAAGGYGRL